jgi:hypothetical protein
LIARRDDFYPDTSEGITADRVKKHFKGICKGGVERFELPNLGALNFLLHESLGGGGTLFDDDGTLRGKHFPPLSYEWKLK